MDFFSILRAICLEHKLFLALAVSLLTLSSLVEASALFGLAPMIDLLIHPDLSQASSITLKIVEGMKSVGLPATVVTVMYLKNEREKRYAV